MKMMAACYQPYKLPFTVPLQSAHGSFAHRCGHVLILRDLDGRKGAGDAAVWPGFGSCQENTEALATKYVIAGLKQAVARLPGLCFETPQQVRKWLQEQDLPVEVAHAVDSALLDLLGQAHGLSVAQLLGGGFVSPVVVHALVASPMQAEQAVQDGATVLKMKIGGKNLEHDVMQVAAVRAAVGDDIAIRLDANGMWSVSTALQAVRQLAVFAPQWIEQPVAANDLEGLRAVRRFGAVPVAADEAISDALSLQAVLAYEAADYVVLKPMFVGGLQAAYDLFVQAQNGGVHGIITHALESAVGRLAAAHLAAALPNLQLACGLGNPLAADLAKGPVIEAHCYVSSEDHGLGVVWSDGVPC